ncbi:LLM class flavin-dependent oxidoreductase [Streptomyces sp. SID4948]|nr:LLM class flavin-dependent oxidoreductase [Streptomyces sp. SID4948]
MHLAAAIDGREQHTADQAADYYVELARLAERGALDFVTLSGCAGAELDTLDTLAVLARVVPATDRIGVVPALAAAGGTPAELARSVATLDRVSQGRAGWTVTAPDDDEAAGRNAGRNAVRNPGRGAAARRQAAERSEERWGRAGRVAEEVGHAWDGGGPYSPQGRPVIAVDITEPAARAVAARHADIAFVRATRKEQADRARSELRWLTSDAGRDPDRLLVLGELTVELGGGELGREAGTVPVPEPDGAGGALFRGGPVDLAELVADWHRSGAVDGFHVRPAEPRRDLERFVNGTAALLQHRGLFRSFHPGATLREHLGLRGPVGSRLAVPRGAMP